MYILKCIFFEKCISLQVCIVMCKRNVIKKPIRKKEGWLAALLLAYLIITGTLRQDVYASNPEPEPSTSDLGNLENIVEQIVSETVTVTEKMVIYALEQAQEALKAEEKALHYDFTLGFAGDICLADNYIPMQHLAEIGSKDISDGIDPRYIKIMQDMDLMWINNEFVYSLRGTPLPEKAWTFRGAPANVSYLKDLGVDIVGLANNHTYDFGKVSFLDTLSTLEKAEIPYVGAGRTIKQAAAPVYLETNGFKIAYVAASRAEYTIYTPQATKKKPGILWCYDNTRFLKSIRTAAANADYVIALPHWGVEHSLELEDVQIEGAHAYIDAGADAVIGAHPHILQGIEYYKGKPILYSLGNFWFDDYDIDTLVAQLHIKGKKANRDASLEDAQVELRLYPGTQSGVYTGLADTPEWKSRILQELESISINISIDKDGVVHKRK